MGTLRRITGSPGTGSWISHHPSTEKQRVRSRGWFRSCIILAEEDYETAEERSKTDRRHWIDIRYAHLAINAGFFSRRKVSHFLIEEDK
jgi:hypothetical protein